MLPEPGSARDQQAADASDYSERQTLGFRELRSRSDSAQQKAQRQQHHASCYNDYRWQRQPAENSSLGRVFRIREKVTFSFRAEFFNVFNPCS